MRQFGVKVMIALGGWNDSADDKYSRLVNDPAARKRFIDNVIDFIITHDFDGLDLDWEYPRCWQVNGQLLSCIDIMITFFPLYRVGFVICINIFFYLGKLQCRNG